MAISNLTSATFDETVNSSMTTVVVDMWAEWCGPCKQIAPILEELAGELAGEVSFVKVNVDENPDLAVRYGVQSIPTLLVIDGGELQKKIVGARARRRCSRSSANS